MPTFKIDGKEVPFEKGDTILRAALRAGIDIPYYCWHPGLSIAANCRMCLVEILPPPGRPPMLLDVLELNRDKGQYVNVKKPKLQPACQVPAGENMEVLSDTSEHVLRARHSVQEFLLLNHPVDCPICDQAGECKLQDYWLDHMKTKKRMRDEPVHKPKGVSFGPTIVYDAERCIICTRCVRFCKEVAKDPVLSVRERGNVNEITVSPGRQLDHPYTFMTEHVCPVGALTTKDFRFKVRVWFLRSAKAVCQGCATGCNAWLDYDPRYQRVYRYRPRDNELVNKFWMCDEGMLSYKLAHEDRITQARVEGKQTKLTKAIAKAAEMLKSAAKDQTAILLSAQHSNQDNFALVSLAKALGVNAMFVTGKPEGEGDDILRHVDKNPNTAGVTLVAGKQPGSFDDFVKAIEGGNVKHVLALGSAVPNSDAEAALKQLTTLVVAGSWNSLLSRHADVFLPACTWAEAHGIFVNAQGWGQESRRAIEPADDARPGWELLGQLASAIDHKFEWTKLKELRAAMPAAKEPEPKPVASEGVESKPETKEDDKKDEAAEKKADASAES